MNSKWLARRHAKLTTVELPAAPVMVNFANQLEETSDASDSATRTPVSEGDFVAEVSCGASTDADNREASLEGLHDTQLHEDATTLSQETQSVYASPEDDQGSAETLQRDVTMLASETPAVDAGLADDQGGVEVKQNQQENATTVSQATPAVDATPIDDQGVGATTSQEEIMAKPASPSIGTRREWFDEKDEDLDAPSASSDAEQLTLKRACRPLRVRWCDEEDEDDLDLTLPPYAPADGSDDDKRKETASPAEQQECCPSSACIAASEPEESQSAKLKAKALRSRPKRQWASAATSWSSTSQQSSASQDESL
eukprot:5900261-Amphidinium_carterae.1